MEALAVTDETIPSSQPKIITLEQRRENLSLEQQHQETAERIYQQIFFVSERLPQQQSMSFRNQQDLSRAADKAYEDHRFRQEDTPSFRAAIRVQLDRRVAEAIEGQSFDGGKKVTINRRKETKPEEAVAKTAEHLRQRLFLNSRKNPYWRSQQLRETSERLKTAAERTVTEHRFREGDGTTFRESVRKSLLNIIKEINGNPN